MITRAFVSSFACQGSGLVCEPLKRTRSGAYVVSCLPSHHCVGIHNASKNACAVRLWLQDGTSKHVIISRNESCFVHSIMSVTFETFAWCYALYEHESLLSKSEHRSPTNDHRPLDCGHTVVAQWVNFLYLLIFPSSFLLKNILFVIGKTPIPSCRPYREAKVRAHTKKPQLETI